jgi:hypothetical protein
MRNYAVRVEGAGTQKTSKAQMIASVQRWSKWAGRNAENEKYGVYDAFRSCVAAFSLVWSFARLMERALRRGSAGFRAIIGVSITDSVRADSCK